MICGRCAVLFETKLCPWKWPQHWRPQRLREACQANPEDQAQFFDESCNQNRPAQITSLVQQLYEDFARVGLEERPTCLRCGASIWAAGMTMKAGGCSHAAGRDAEDTRPRPSLRRSSKTNKKRATVTILYPALEPARARQSTLCRCRATEQSTWGPTLIWRLACVGSLHRNRQR